MPGSLHGRLLLAAGIVLAAFLGMAGFALDHGFRATALAAVQDRLKSQIFVLLGLADLDSPDRPLNDVLLPDQTLATPESGHYAQIHDAGGRVVWRSRSMLGLTIEWPGQRAAGDFVFNDALSSTDEALYCLSYLVHWEARDTSGSRAYTFHACEGRAAYSSEVHRFRRSMGLWLMALGGMLLLIQLLVLRWGLRPLRRIAAELREMESGEREAITGHYPNELQALAGNLNALLSARNSHLQRYRHALGDLAHSLKTPLAVIRTTLEHADSPRGLARILREPLDQLDATIRYQLQRAATAGRSALARPVAVAPVVDRLLDSLRKVYHARALELSAAVESGLLFAGDQGDLMEVIGNLADNACKWARANVSVEVQAWRGGDRVDARGIVIRVHDDGPGLPPDRVEEVMQRGARLDQSVEGHGIGLATVREIVEGAYSGALRLESRPGKTVAEATLFFA